MVTFYTGPTVRAQPLLTISDPYTIYHLRISEVPDLTSPFSGLRLHPGPAQDPRGGPALPQVARGGAADRAPLRLVHPAAVAAPFQGGAPLALARTDSLIEPRGSHQPSENSVNDL